MEENKNLENLEETVEEVAEEVTETVEEVTEEIEEAAEEVVEAVEEAAEPVVEEPVEIKKGSKVGAIVAVVVAIIVVAAAVITSNMEFNKYNKMGYINVSGNTVQDLIDQQGMTLEEFLEMYELPADMTADTTEAAAFYNIPVKKIAEMNGIEYDVMKTAFEFPETVTETTPWGEAEGEITLGKYYGEDNIDSFKEQYGLGDEITAETKWKEVRTIVQTKELEMRKEQEAAMKEAAEAPEVPAEGEAEAPADAPAEAPAEGEAEETPADAE